MLSKLSIKKPLLIVVIVLIVIALGIVSYINTPVDLLPEMDLPYLIIVTVFPGAPPDIVEKDVTTPIEATVAKVSGIKSMSSVSSEHFSMITLELNADIGKVKQDIESGLKLTSLPDDPLRQDPIIIEVSPDLLPMMTVSIGVRGEELDKASDYLKEVAERISAVDGVASVSAGGIASNYVLMNLNTQKTAEAFITGIADLLNIKIEIPVEIKENIHSSLEEALEEADGNPELSTDGKLDAEKLFDYLLEGLQDLLSQGDAQDELITEIIFDELKNENSELRKELIDTLDILLASRYIIADTEESKKVFYDLLDGAFYSGLTGFASGYTGSMLSLINSEILSQVIMAQDFNMPAGSITKGAQSFIVKVGDKISSREEFMNAAVISVDLGNSIKEYVNNIERVLTLLSYASENGVYSITESTIRAAAAALSVPGAVESIEFLQDILGEELYASLARIMRGAEEDEIYSALVTLIRLLEKYGGEGAVTVEEDELTHEKTYSIDVIILKETLTRTAAGLSIDLKLKDLADMLFINDAAKLPTRLLTNDGKGNFSLSQSVVVVVEKEAAASATKVSADIKALLKSIAEEKETFSYNIISDDGDMINFMMDTVLDSLLWGALLATGVLLLFFRRIKPTLAVGTAIVFSVVFTFVLMYFANITLNIVSMGGLALGVGMLVDNSIVVIENIQRLRAQGKTRFEASVQGAKQMSSAIIASTLTTIVVFLPIVFIKGLVKEIMSDMALTVCFSLLASLFVALTVIPISTAYFIKEMPKGDFRSLRAVKRAYIKSLNFSLNNKWLVLIVTMVLFAGCTLGGFLLSKTEIFPETYMGYVGVEFDIKSEAVDERNFGLSVMDENYMTMEDIQLEVAEKAIQVFNNYPDIKAVAIYVNSGFDIGGFSIGGGTLTASLSLVEEKQRTAPPLEVCKDMERELNAAGGRLFSATVNVNSILAYSAAFSDSDYTINIYGNDYELMSSEADKLSQLISQSDKVLSVKKGVDVAGEEYKLIVDKDKASKYGLTTAQVYLQVSDALKEVSGSNTLRLYDASNTAKSDYEVMIYTRGYALSAWYMAEQDGKQVKVYVNNNYDYSGADNEYYVKNTSGNTVLVKNKGKVKPVEDGGFIPVTLDGTSFSYEYAEIEQTEGESAIVFMNVQFSFNQKTLFHSIKREEVDLLSLTIQGSDMLQTGGKVASVPLYKLLKEDCFARDAGGEVLYRRVGGEDVPAALVKTPGYTGINHSEGRKVIGLSITYDTTFSLNEIEKDISAAVAEYNQSRPTGIIVDAGQTVSVMDEVMNNLYLILGAAIILIYLIMVAQFQSWKKPFIVMFTVPLAFTGSFILMLATGTSINIMSLVGLIILMGVVVNNGIVFVDYADKVMESGEDKRKALLRTGVDRLRPILLTALTTISALIIMAADTSDYGLLLSPLAISMVGGLTYATFVTLYAVPIVYDIFNRKYKIPEQIQALRDADIDKIDENNIFEETDPYYYSQIQKVNESKSMSMLTARRLERKRKRQGRKGYRSMS